MTEVYSCWRDEADATFRWDGTFCIISRPASVRLYATRMMPMYEWHVRGLPRPSLGRRRTRAFEQCNRAKTRVQVVKRLVHSRGVSAARGILVDLVDNLKAQLAVRASHLVCRQHDGGLWGKRRVRQQGENCDGATEAIGWVYLEQSKVGPFSCDGGSSWPYKCHPPRTIFIASSPG